MEAQIVENESEKGALTILQVAKNIYGNGEVEGKAETGEEMKIENHVSCEENENTESDQDDQGKELSIAEDVDEKINQTIDKEFECIENSELSKQLRSDAKMHLNELIDLSDITNYRTKDLRAADLLTGNISSSNDSSCVNSPTVVNFNESVGNFSVANMSVLVKEYNALKLSHQTLQTDYQNCLEREKDLCKRIQDQAGQEDESCNSLMIVNNELRTELEKVVADLQRSRTENKRLQDSLKNSKCSEADVGTAKIEKLEDIVKLERIVSELEAECKSVEVERDIAKEKLAAHDAAAKRAITSLQKEMALRVDQVTKMYEDMVKEKDVTLVKIAKLESVIESCKKKTELSEKKTSDCKKEIERLKTVVKQKDTDYNKLQILLDEKDVEFCKCKDELAKIKDEDSSQAMKVKWAQNKLKQELEAHKETKLKLNQAQSKIDQVKEEGEQIRGACQEMIKKYQNSEEMRSNQLDMELKEKDNKLKIHEHEIAVQDEMHRMRTQELEALKTEHRKAMTEISQLKNTLSIMEGKLSNHSIRNGELEKKVEILTRREEEADATDKLLHDANKDLKGYEEQVSYYVELEDRLRKQLADSEAEVTESRKKENELLSFTEKITENNAHWKSQAFDLQSKVDELTDQITHLRKSKNESNIEKKTQDEKLRKQREEYDSNLEELVFQIEQKRKLVEQLTMSLEEAQDEVKVQKRKTASTIKDLQRQLQQSRKRLEQLEEAMSNSQENMNFKSRTSSNSSLDRLSNDSAPQISTSITTVSNGSSIQSIQSPAYSHYSDYSIVQPSRQTRGHSGGEIEVDKAVLVDRICRLQKAHAKKNEKMEFMEEHISSLLEEMKKKNRIVQYYVAREESGMLASNKFDRNKAEMSKKGGIMASVYSSQISDKHMTLDLSLEINRKLQAVLEDTLLKNITLKENINTLGTEIARLQEDMKRARR